MCVKDHVEQGHTGKRCLLLLSLESTLWLRWLHCAEVKMLWLPSLHTIYKLLREIQDAKVVFVIQNRTELRAVTEIQSHNKNMEGKHCILQGSLDVSLSICIGHPNLHPVPCSGKLHTSVAPHRSKKPKGADLGVLTERGFCPYGLGPSLQKKARVGVGSQNLRGEISL